MSRSVKLTITEPVITSISGDSGFYVKFVLIDPVEMTNNLFVHRINSPLLGDEFFEFSHVASPSDIEEYPEGVATITQSDFFRLNEAEFLFKTIDLLVNTRLEVQNKISDIIKRLNALDTLEITNTFDITF